VTAVDVSFWPKADIGKRSTMPMSEADA